MDRATHHPFTFGARPAIIVLPRELAAAPDDQVRAVLVHELLHVVRRDWRWMIAEEAVRTALWFHPAVWLAVNELRQAREEVIDRQAARLIGSRRTYLRILLALADRPDARWLAPSLSFFRSRQLARRVAAIVGEKSMSRPRLALAAAVVFVLAGGTIAAAARLFPLPLSPLSDLEQQAASATTRVTGAQLSTPGPLEQRA